MNSQIKLSEKELNNIKNQICDFNKDIQIDALIDWVNDLEQENADFKNRNAEAKDMIKELYEGLDKLYLSGLSDKQIAFIERLQDKTEQFLKDCDIDNAIQQANKELDFDKIADEMEQDLKDSEVEK